jgi:hypothetical protein
MSARQDLADTAALVEEALDSGDLDAETRKALTAVLILLDRVATSLRRKTKPLIVVRKPSRRGR